jgi:hypothetical protein
MEAKMDTNQKEMNVKQERTDTNLNKMEAEIRANNEKFQVLQGTLVSQTDIHQARTEAVQEKMDANLKEEMMAWQRDEGLPRGHNGCLCRKDRGHGFGGKSRRKSKHQGVPNEEAMVQTIGALED